MENKELLGCPFCGNEAHKQYRRSALSKIDKLSDIPGLYFIICTICFIQTPFYNSLVDAINHWNSRDKK